MTLRRFKERKREDGRKKKGKIREGRKGGTGDEGEKRKQARKGEGGKERRCALTRYWSHSRFLDLTSLTDK